jgi:hypothetical protein
LWSGEGEGVVVEGRRAENGREFRLKIYLEDFTWKYF